MWTAFETLAGDLWEMAVNERPDILAQLKGRGTRLRKGARTINTPKEERSDDHQKKQVRLDLIQFHRWDLRKKMGAVHKVRFEFSRLDGIREAYASAFPEKEGSKDIDAALTDDALDALSALRNVIVHRGAKADKEYVARCSYLPSLPKAEEGATISIDGQIATHAIGEAIFCSYKLIETVDTWLADHGISDRQSVPNIEL